MPAKSGGPCVVAPGKRGLCHLHDPDGAFALQHPQYRDKLLNRPEVRALLGRQTPPSAATAPMVTVRRTSPTGTYAAELEYLIDAAAKLIAASQPAADTDAGHWRVRERTWRANVAAARELKT